MKDPKRFFEDNISRLSAQQDPIQWNLNQGLYALCQKIDHLEANQQEMDRMIRKIGQLLQSR